MGVSLQISEILKQWAKAPGVCAIRKLSDTRRRVLLTRLKDPDWDWQQALGKFPLKCFSANGAWKPDIDWFLRVDTVNKILEGKYDFTPVNRGNNNQPPELPLEDQFEDPDEPMFGNPEMIAKERARRRAKYDNDPEKIAAARKEWEAKQEEDDG